MLFTAKLLDLELAWGVAVGLLRLCQFYSLQTVNMQNSVYSLQTVKTPNRVYSLQAVKLD